MEAAECFPQSGGCSYRFLARSAHVALLFALQVIQVCSLTLSQAQIVSATPLQSVVVFLSASRILPPLP